VALVGRAEWLDWWQQRWLAQAHPPARHISRPTTPSHPPTQPPAHPPTRPPDAGVEEGSHAVEVQGSKGGGVLHGEAVVENGEAVEENGKAVVENGEAVVERPANGVLQVKLDSARQPFLMHANAHAHGHSSTSMRPPE
jgi:hypothetical protein